MKKLTPKGIKILKIFHLIFIMIWAMGVVTMTILCLLTPQSGDELYMIFKITRTIDDVLVIPGAVMSVITGIIYGLFTNWGFFKHKWITVKWICSIIIILLGTFYFSPILDNSLQMSDLSRDEVLNTPEIAKNIQIAFWGGICQGSALIILIIISVIKPWKNKTGNRKI